MIRRSTATTSESGSVQVVLGHPRHPQSRSNTAETVTPEKHCRPTNQRRPWQVSKGARRLRQGCSEGQIDFLALSWRSL